MTKRKLEKEIARLRQENSNLKRDHSRWMNLMNAFEQFIDERIDEKIEHRLSKLESER